ncbi:MAG: hypothetical protein M1268_00675 [Patescibacteria group bacterium]|nr:hypothetical protein [Patescibacteria group bacterium]
MKKTFYFIGFIVFTIIILSILQIAISNSLSTKGIVLEKINREIDGYKKENFFLREKLLLATSYTVIASEASIAGFTKEKSQVVLTSPLPLAIRQ